MNAEDLLNRRVKVHEDGHETAAAVTYVGTYTDPVTGRMAVEAVSVRTDDGEDWAGVPITLIEVL